MSEKEEAWMQIGSTKETEEKDVLKVPLIVMGSVRSLAKKTDGLKRTQECRFVSLR